MKEYTPENPPTRGRARRIWKSLEAAGITLYELHYNPNCWGADRTLGWGSWACTLSQWDTRSYSRHEDAALFFCGELPDGRVYLEQLTAPYHKWVLKSEERADVRN